MKAHGDCKPSVDGALRATTMCGSNNDYLVRLLYNKHQVLVATVDKKDDELEQKRALTAALTAAVDVPNSGAISTNILGLYRSQLI